MIALFEATGGEQWTRKQGWNTSAPLSKWEGITVDTLFGEERVVKIDLQEYNLTGELPEAFFDLPYLEALNFSSNKLSGPLSESIAKFKNLRILSCAVNGFNGELPKGLAKLQKIEHINLNGNKFSGALPAEYSELLDRMKASPIEETPPLYEKPVGGIKLVRILFEIKADFRCDLDIAVT